MLLAAAEPLATWKAGHSRVATAIADMAEPCRNGSSGRLWSGTAQAASLENLGLQMAREGGAGALHHADQSPDDEQAAVQVDVASEERDALLCC